MTLVNVEPAWDETRDDVVFPPAPDDVSPHLPDTELRSLLESRLDHAHQHPEELLTIAEFYDSLVEQLKK
jgi:hypothetical protein